ncbi:hypothetical protein BB561_002371 [Smittium simulii]|uniref:Cytochrome b-c1 complex subunit Rieske, mitochondrial n=1 Tax=Smittium simulii TaxID=133385 RepID=A0A2T9YQN0_9FUNG|nr:hypothetical protein BB561_002371 [Smittium simulii]
MNISRAIANNRTFFTAPVTETAFRAAFPNATHKLSKTRNISEKSSNANITNYTSKLNFNIQRRLHSTFSPSTPSTAIPSFAGYTKDEASASRDKNRVFSYLMLGATGTVLASTAQASVHGFLVNLAASADVLAVSKLEVDLSNIKIGDSVTVKWRGKPVFVRHRTNDQITQSELVPMSELVDPQTDAERVKIPEWLVLVGICTHLGCVPIKDSGDFGAYYCPCHGSHYDYSGRIRKGPAPLNLEIPEYIIDGNLLTIG